MKTRWSAVLVLVGIVLSLSGLMAGQNIVTPRTALATTTGCISSTDYFGCQLSGSSTGAGWRVQNSNTSGTGVFGVNIATSGTTYGVVGHSYSTTGRGVVGYAAATSGTNYGVIGKTESSSGYGVYGQNTSGGIGVYGTGDAGVYGVGGSYGVYGFSDLGDAGFFHGDVVVLGTVFKSAGSFKIDHPLDPANKYLSHSFVESPDMMNIYNGNVTLDKHGEAIVDLPAWFEALNKEFRYQLTAMDGPGPNLYIAKEIAGNRFRIAGGKPGMRVSWQVTGIRHDPYAEQHRIQVEQDKPSSERGTYLYPQGYGQPETKGRDYAMQQQMHSAEPAEHPSQ